MKMQEIKRVYILGLGAMGGLYASKFEEMQPGTVKVIANEERRKAFAKKPLIVNGKTYPLNFVAPGSAEPVADLIIVAVKYPQLQQAIEDIKGFVGESTTVISLLNGISSEEIIAKEIGMNHLLLAYGVGMDALRNGTTVNYANTGRLVFGERVNTEYSPRVLAIKKLLERADIPHVIPENMEKALWSKFMLNVGVNQASSILKAPFRVFQQNDEARDLMILAAQEVVAISQKCGINLDDSDVSNFVATINGLDPNGKTSMLQDIEAGRKTEVEIFSGAVIELGKKWNVPTPVNDMFFRIIKVLEQM